MRLPFALILHATVLSIATVDDVASAEPPARASLPAVTAPPPMLVASLHLSPVYVKYTDAGGVHSDTESIAVRPNGILEFGTSNDAPRPKWEGRAQMSIHDYYFTG